MCDEMRLYLNRLIEYYKLTGCARYDDLSEWTTTDSYRN